MTKSTLMKAFACLFCLSLVALIFGWGVSAQQTAVALTDPQVDDNKTYVNVATWPPDQKATAAVTVR